MFTSNLNTLHSKYQDNIQESISGFSERSPPIKKRLFGFNNCLRRFQKVK